jgi:hypothetical protein
MKTIKVVWTDQLNNKIYLATDGKKVWAYNQNNIAESLYNVSFNLEPGKADGKVECVNYVKESVLESYSKYSSNMKKFAFDIRLKLRIPFE